MPTFNAVDIVGSTLYAKQRVDIKRQPWDNDPIIQFVEAGEPIGVVDTWVEPREGRQSLYWGFNDSQNNSYWVEHKKGVFDIQSLNNQGLISLEEQAWNEKPWYERLLVKVGSFGAIGTIGYLVLKKHLS